MSMHSPRRLAATVFVSLDGVVESPEKWSFPYWNDEIGKFKFEETFASDALLLGRVTYEGFAAAWPSRKDPDGFADRFNTMPKYVASRTLKTLAWNNSHLIEGDLAKAVSKLKRELDGEIVVPASYQLGRTLIEHDLVDELRLVVFPVVLGAGERLFGKTSDKKPMRLVGTQTVDGDVAFLTYERVRDA